MKLKKNEITEEDLEDDRYVSLPELSPDDDREIMKGFARSCKDRTVCNSLENALEGRGGFRRFKDMVQDMGLSTGYYDYRNRKIKEIIMSWCQENGIEIEGETVHGKA